MTTTESHEQSQERSAESGEEIRQRPDEGSGERSGEEARREAGLIAQLTAYSGIIAPTSLITALLFYFGYLATRARFEYFGVYLDLVNLSTPDLLLFGSEALYVPVVIVGLAVLVSTGLRLAVQWLLADPGRDTVSGWVTLAVLLVSLLLLLRAVIGLAPQVARTEYPGITALSLTLGALLLTYCETLWRTLAARRPQAAWTPPPATVRTARLALIALMVAGLFWTANSFSFLYGNGQALNDAQNLPERPPVILDTHDPIQIPPKGVVHIALPDEKFRHRYIGLRLLVESDKRLFLVPARWSRTTSRTIVIENSSDIRLQLAPPR
ncbi:hypothetical protein ABGB18_06770 [Nonomuraea sp. B12E4]|uniref:hypothetical protein n=1 Tax=Nonomuraea sp. B12E4 TaxID=3153564 RepID=UPI00325DC20B